MLQLWSRWECSLLALTACPTETLYLNDLTTLWTLVRSVTQPKLSTWDLRLNHLLLG